jgi:hypothetical protein
VTTLQGVFCANVWSRQTGHWERCKGVWCGECFQSDEEDGVPIGVPTNDGGEAAIVNMSDEGRFTCARNGDYLMTRFQCEKCHFWNIQRRDPKQGTEAMRYLRDVSVGRWMLFGPWKRMLSKAQERACERPFRRQE